MHDEAQMAAAHLKVNCCGYAAGRRSGITALRSCAKIRQRRNIRQTDTASDGLQVMPMRNHCNALCAPTQVFGQLDAGRQRQDRPATWRSATETTRRTHKATTGKTPQRAFRYATAGETAMGATYARLTRAFAQDLLAACAPIHFRDLPGFRATKKDDGVASDKEETVLPTMRTGLLCACLLGLPRPPGTECHVTISFASGGASKEAEETAFTIYQSAAEQSRGCS